MLFFCFKQKTAYEMRISDWSSDVCSSDLDLRGKIVVLHFIYAGCPDVCPLHADLIGRVQEMVNQTPMRDQVQFVTVTTDPERDTAEVLRGYGEAHGLNPANWVFLTSGAERPTATREQIGRAHV